MIAATLSITLLKMSNAAVNLKSAALRTWPVSVDRKPSSISGTMSVITPNAVCAF